MDCVYDDIILEKLFCMVSSDVYSYCMFTFRSSAELLLKYDASTNIPDNSGKHTLITYESYSFSQTLLEKEKSFKKIVARDGRWLYDS